MAIELPPRPSADDDSRLALLEDPELAERLFRENPALFSYEPPRTQREVLAWATRRVGTLALAVTAAASIAAGYLVAGFALHRETPRAVPAAAEPHAVAAQHRAALAPRHSHHAAHIVAQPHAAAAVVTAPVAPVAPRIVHVAPVAPEPSHEAQLMRAKVHAQQAEIARLRAEATEAAAQAARAHAQAVDAQAAVRSRTQTQPATATATEPVGSGENAASRTSPLDAPQPEGGKPATNTGGGWTSHGAYGTAVPGGPPPIWGPADPCTPHGGRTGIVMQMVQAAAVAGLGRLR